MISSKVVYWLCDACQVRQRWRQQDEKEKRRRRRETRVKYEPSALVETKKKAAFYSRTTASERSWRRWRCAACCSEGSSRLRNAQNFNQNHLQCAPKFHQILIFILFYRNNFFNLISNNMMTGMTDDWQFVIVLLVHALKLIA